MSQVEIATPKTRRKAQGVGANEGSIARIRELAQARVAIEGVEPMIDAGRFAVKRLAGETLTVSADIFTDGHEIIDAALITRGAGDADWRETPFTFLTNDRWAASVSFDRPGPYRYSIIAWRDVFATWASDTKKKRNAGVDIALELREGQILLEKAAASGRGSKDDQKRLKALRARIDKLAAKGGGDALYEAMTEADTALLLREVGVRENLSRFEIDVPVWVDREAAGFSAWYELMPRSQSGDVNRHGTFDDVIKRLPDIEEMGFDVLYFPPIHPIGKTNRKGKNNNVTAQEGEPGSPYAIGSAEGGHKDLHPELGSFADFQRLVTRAADHGLEIAIDFAIQCSPDHPWIKEHPDWFDWRPDGSIKYAENPPKKYQDIVNVDFYAGGAIPWLWLELRDVVLFWLDKGVRIFRVDNPHTKPFPFWEWMIAEVRERDPGAVFLAEAFTRPKLMKRLAKVGYNQSYSYFTWRNRKWELREYLTELTTAECAEFMRPNFFVNTPDINPLFLQTSGRPGFQLRLALAATLAGNYGVYSGFELCESEPLAPGKEEYLNSEKYEIRAFDWRAPGNIREDIRFFNRIRRSEPALRDFRNLEFYNFWNDEILYYGRRTPDLSSFLLVMVSLDPHHPQGGHFEVPLWEFDLPDNGSVKVEDLVTGQQFVWSGKVQHWWFRPDERPYAVFRISV
ncbi:alpha-1,4-glucan--maltose-1-phosphate maltosyltransferase [Aureimonas jatrophae]|uniref:Alpha-1,4-glucan:maltose-1-phosphate maltosyltransferase n=1 Tax=Aureimonas jatrophae TaxID=1166073 RepID=A0A1H0HM70_9HYPH|nr:alpha-1,4-glucan--maltose-1-phosphate maltosyltransferase [Aureimonas jatrophae]MBB3950667.1 starch synthase (maltosyl-transferring) [Aureimonas jatrophae]SDO20275.1 alpha-1,4-glucan:maltose-1-phosphate maltosyltransferase [Aureimonas jatrophae]